MTAPGYSVEALVPQAPPMVLLDGIESLGDSEIRARVTVRQDSMFARDGGVPVHVGIEYMAQTCAAFAGYEARQSGGEPQIGLLLGTRKFSATRAFFQPGDVLSVIAVLSYREEGMGVFDCVVECDGDVVAQAGLTVFQPKEPVTFSAGPS